MAESPPPEVEVSFGASALSEPRRGRDVFAERRAHRKRDLQSSPGVLREHAKIVAAAASGKMHLDAADKLSRIVRRHADIVSLVEQAQTIAEIQRQLEALRDAGPAGLLTVSQEVGHD